MSFIPNTTPTPNWLYNGEMKRMSDTDLRVVLVITRATLGWIVNKRTGARKLEDYISQKQFIEKTGKSNRAIATAIQNCVEHGWIEGYDKDGNLLDTPQKRARRKVIYRLGDIFASRLSSENSSQDTDNQRNQSGEVISESGENSSPNLVKKVHSTKEKERNSTKGSNASVAGRDFSLEEIREGDKKVRQQCQ